ncbi:MAG: EpsI family protein [Verrucomicrobia bacterium]|nr:EpsI family protein [Verrucomicrobiota bacterium]
MDVTKLKKQKWMVFGVVAALVGGAGAVLNQLQASHRLGNPGLKMVQRAVYATDATNRWVVCTNTIDLPARVLDYGSEEYPVTKAEVDWLPNDTTYGRRHYTNANSRIDISIVLMGKDHTSIHRPEICLTGQGWEIERSELVTIPIQKPVLYELAVMKLTARKVFVESGRAAPYRALFVYWFVSENRMTARHEDRLWWMATDLLRTGVLSRWAYIAYFSVCRPGEEEAAFNRMKSFIAASVPQFQLPHGLPERDSPPSAREGRP